MAIQSLNLNNSQPLKVNQVSSSGENISNAPKYRMAYMYHYLLSYMTDIAQAVTARVDFSTT